MKELELTEENKSEMSIEKIVKTRKEHLCSCCSEIIPKGVKSIYYTVKNPKYNDSDEQVGIEYFTGWYCYDENVKIEYEGEMVIKMPSCG